MTGRLPAAVVPVVLAAAFTAGCGGGAGDGQPAPPPTPDLSGARVMLMPARPGEPATLDRELARQLTDRAPATDWIQPEEVEGTIASNPGSRFDLGAPRTVVDVGGGQLRVEDPLYTDLRRLGAILDADLALVPVGTGESTDSLGTSVSLAAVLVSIRGGWVLWTHTVTGEPTDTKDAAVASAAAALARTLTREEG